MLSKESNMSNAPTTARKVLEWAVIFIMTSMVGLQSWTVCKIFELERDGVQRTGELQSLRVIVDKNAVIRDIQLENLYKQLAKLENTNAEAHNEIKALLHDYVKKP
jgi:hypothetical protein